MGEYSSVVLEGLGFTDGDDNTPGIQEDAWYIPASYFVDGTGLKVPSPSTTSASLIEITTDHILKAGKAPIPMGCLFEKSGMEAAMAGEIFSKVFMQNAKFFVPQPDETNAANIGVLKNSRGIILVKRTGGTDLIQIGTKGLYAKIKDGKLDLGTGPTGAPGIELTFEAPGVMPYLVYKGVFPAPAP